MRVLLVDDSKTARMMLKKIFTELGEWEVFEADDGQRALDQLKSITALDLICVDWNMPIMNGLEFIVAARKIIAGKDTWFMMITSETEMNSVIKAINSGANEYIMKPFTKEMVREKLELMGFPTNN